MPARQRPGLSTWNQSPCLSGRPGPSETLARIVLPRGGECSVHRILTPRGKDRWISGTWRATVGSEEGVRAPVSKPRHGIACTSGKEFAAISVYCFSICSRFLSRLRLEEAHHFDSTLSSLLLTIVQPIHRFGKAYTDRPHKCSDNDIQLHLDSLPPVWSTQFECQRTSQCDWDFEILRYGVGGWWCVQGEDVLTSPKFIRSVAPPVIK